MSRERPARRALLAIAAAQGRPEKPHHLTPAEKPSGVCGVSPRLRIPRLNSKLEELLAKLAEGQCFLASQSELLQQAVPKRVDLSHPLADDVGCRALVLLRCPKNAILRVERRDVAPGPLPV